MHGKVSQIHHDGAGVLTGVSNPLQATRYHSLVVEPSSVPDQPGGHRHHSRRRHHGGAPPLPGGGGLQFHPESQMTVDGHAILANFLGSPPPESQRPG